MDDKVIYFSKAKFSSLKSISELCGVGRDDTSKKTQDISVIFAHLRILYSS